MDLLSVIAASRRRTSPFDPLSTSPMVWYDGLDPGFTLVSGKVSQWTDKSGNGYHATQSNATYRATPHGSGGITTGAGLEHVRIPILPNDSLSMIMVATNTSSITSSTTPSLIPFAAVGGVSNGTAYGSATGALTNEVWCVFDDSVANRFVDRQGVSNTNLASIPSGNHIYSTVLDTNWHMGFDGSSDLRNLSGGVRRGFLTSVHSMGLGTDTRNWPTPAMTWPGAVHEFFLWSGALTLTNRQKIEGYLAHKYSLTGNLPGGHPYKTTPPTA